MFIVDSVLLFPFKSLLALAREIREAALQELAAEGESIRAELSRLYRALEAGTLSEGDFDARERELLDRLDAVEARGRIEGDDAGEDDEGEGDEGEDDEGGGEADDPDE